MKLNQTEKQQNKELVRNPKPLEQSQLQSSKMIRHIENLCEINHCLNYCKTKAQTYKQQFRFLTKFQGS